MQNISLFYEPVWYPPVGNAELQYLNCTNTTENGDPGRLLMSLSFSLQYSSPDSDLAPADYLRNLSGLLCQPTLSLMKRPVSGLVLSSTNKSPIVTSDATTQGLNAFIEAPNNVVMPILTSLVNSRAADTDIVTKYNEVISAWFALLNETAPQKDVTAWADGDLLNYVS